MPLFECSTCTRFFKAPAVPQGQDAPDECPRCKTTREMSLTAKQATPSDEVATPKGYRSWIVFGIAALIGAIIFWAVGPWEKHALPMAIMSAVLGFAEPRRPWRWGIALVCLPLLFILATGPFERDPPGQETMHLWPLVAAFLVVWGGVCGLLASLGALLRNLKTHR